MRAGAGVVLLFGWAALAQAAPVAPPSSAPVAKPPSDPLAARFPDAQLDDRALCDRLMARTAADAVFADPEPRNRRKVIVSDLHLGPGSADPRFSGIDDF